MIDVVQAASQLSNPGRVIVDTNQQCVNFRRQVASPFRFTKPTANVPISFRSLRIARTLGVRFVCERQGASRRFCIDERHRWLAPFRSLIVRAILSPLQVIVVRSGGWIRCRLARDTGLATDYHYSVKPNPSLWDVCLRSELPQPAMSEFFEM
jgi:hypothetical protein